MEKANLQERNSSIGLYYRIWVDCIKRGKMQPANRQNWQVVSMILMTMAMVFNLLLGMTVLERFVFKDYFYKIELPFLPSYLNNALSGIILFVLPSGLINYWLIFRNKRYKKLLDKYPYYNGKLFLAYFATSMMLPLLLMWIGILSQRV